MLPTNHANHFIFLRQGRNWKDHFQHAAYFLAQTVHIRFASELKYVKLIEKLTALNQHINAIRY